MFYGMLAIATALTWAMFQTKQMMLGFPCAIFWALFGAYNYTLSTSDWDIYFLVAFASLLGMVSFSMFAAFALRTKKEEAIEGDQFMDEGGDDDVTFIDEKKKETGESRRVRVVRENAEKRRKYGIKRKTRIGDI